MATKPPHLKLVPQSAASHRPERNLVYELSKAIDRHKSKADDERMALFQRSFMPHASIMARLPRHDRDALIAHFRAKEMRNVADALHVNDHYHAGRARRRLARVEEMAKAFETIDHQWWGMF